MKIPETAGPDHRAVASKAEQLALQFERADFREELIRALPIGGRRKQLLLALDALCSEHGIREKGDAIVEATIEQILERMPCSRRTLLYELARIRDEALKNDECPYLTPDTERGRTGLYSIHFGPMIDEWRPSPGTERSAASALHQCKTGAIAPVQKCKKEGVQPPSSFLDPDLPTKNSCSKEEAAGRKHPPPDAEDVELAELLLSLVREILPRLKTPKLEKWAQVFRLLRERDARTPDEIRGMLDWIFHAPECWAGWRTVILSPRNLREKWDKIEAQRNARRPRSLNGPGVSFSDGGKNDDWEM